MLGSIAQHPWVMLVTYAAAMTTLVINDAAEARCMGRPRLTWGQLHLLASGMALAAFLAACLGAAAIFQFYAACVGFFAVAMVLIFWIDLVESPTDHY